jgi:hypothetical protein
VPEAATFPTESFDAGALESLADRLAAALAV